MSFLTKFGIIEERIPDLVNCDDTGIPLDIPTADIPDSITESLVDDIYSKNGLSDQSRSIYKVDMFMNTLPKEMPIVTKKATVIGILKAAGLTAEEVLEDGDNRKAVLSKVRAEIDRSNNNEISEAEKMIEQLKAEIEEYNLKIYNSRTEMAAADERIDLELKVIEELQDFMGGDKTV